MTPAEFRAWQERLGLTYEALTKLTGWAANTIKKYRTDGTEIRRDVALACEGLEARLGKRRVARR